MVWLDFGYWQESMTTTRLDLDKQTISMYVRAEPGRLSRSFGELTIKSAPPVLEVPSRTMQESPRTGGCLVSVVAKYGHTCARSIRGRGQVLFDDGMMRAQNWCSVIGLPARTAVPRVTILSVDSS